MDLEENEVNIPMDLEENNVMIKTEKVEKLKDQKSPSESSDSGDILDRQRLINYIFSEGYDKRNYPTNITVQLGVALIKINIVS